MRTTFKRSAHTGSEHTGAKSNEQFIRCVASSPSCDVIGGDIHVYIYIYICIYISCSASMLCIGRACASAVRERARAGK